MGSGGNSKFLVKLFTKKLYRTADLRRYFEIFDETFFQKVSVKATFVMPYSAS